MSSKIHTPPPLTEEEMLERIRQYQSENESGQLVHFESVEQFQAHLASLPHYEAFPYGLHD